MSAAIEIELQACVVCADQNTPRILTIPNPPGSGPDALPAGPFQPDRHATLETGLRGWVEEQTALPLGYVEQLYTFGDTGRQRSGPDGNTHHVSIGYLALVHVPGNIESWNDSRWKSWYHYLPWEDRRSGPPAILTEHILPRLTRWVDNGDHHESPHIQSNRKTRFHLAFGLSSTGWDEERVLERYELMYEAGLIGEAVTDGRTSPEDFSGDHGVAMLHDHRRILATAMARMRSKLKYRPIVFELLPEQFTLTELQSTVETLSGQKLHKQNFRRMVEKAELVEPTGQQAQLSRGRPAAYFRFRRAVTLERPAPGLKLGGR